MLRILPFLACLLLGSPLYAADMLPGAGGSTSSAVLGGGKATFLRVEQAYPLRAGILDGKLLFEWDITPGYYLYRERLSFATRDAAGSHPLAAVLPPGEPHEDAYLGATEVYRGPLTVALALPAETVTVVEVRSQGCADAGLCYPPRRQLFALDAIAGTLIETANVPLAEIPAAQHPDDSVARVLYMALLAALGGLILNLMPCVFPVLSLKVLSIAGKGGDGSGKALHGLVYTLGVVLSFMAVAALLIGLRQAGAAIGWGFHLQSPVFVAALAYLFFVLGLSLSGMINLGAGIMGMGGTLAAKSGYAGTFFTGVLATVVASPCSAPFMGTALGFAMTQPAASALAIFAALGFGMAAPFLLLTLSPAVLRHLPRPGAWMDGFKQFLAFPLYAAAVWLLWVLGKQSGVNGMAAVSGGCVLLALGLWIWERSRLHEHVLAVRALALVALVLALLVLRSPLLSAQAATPPGPRSAGNWENYDPARLAQLRSEGRAVFVNVTADWCITCLANEKLALGSAAVTDAFAQRGISYLKGDWTNTDPLLTRLLLEHGRSGVPLYLYYPAIPGAGPRILPQLLTPGIVMDAIGAG